MGVICWLLGHKWERISKEYGLLAYRERDRCRICKKVVATDYPTSPRERG